MNFLFSPFTDDEIIEILRSGPPAKARRVEFYLCDNRFKKFQNVGWAKSILSDFNDRFDAYNESIYIFITKAQKGKFESGKSIDAFFNKIFHDNCINIFRRNTGKTVSAFGAGEIPVDELHGLSAKSKDILSNLIIAEDFTNLLERLEKMGNCFWLIVLRHYDGLKPIEIADILNLTESTTRARLSQCMKQLREQGMGRQLNVLN